MRWFQKLREDGSKARQAQKEAQERLDRTLELKAVLDRRLDRIDRLRRENHIYDSVLLTFRGHREGEHP